MRLTIILLTACFLQLSAAGFAQRITLSEQNTSLEKIIQKIRKQSGYDFLVDSKLIKKAKPVSVNLKNVTIQEALNACLSDQEMIYTIEDKIVLLNPKPVSVMDNAISSSVAVQSLILSNNLKKSVLCISGIY
jgi:type II secretory pathway component GspD/PulD (secretin)